MQPILYVPVPMPMASTGNTPPNQSGGGQAQPQPYLVMQPGSHVPAPMAMTSTANPGYPTNQTGGAQVQPQPYLMMQHGTGGHQIQPQITSVPTPNNTAPFAISVRKGRALLGLGIVQVVLGVLSIVFNGVGYYVETSYTIVAPGIWAGVLFVVSGAIGIVAGLRKSKAWVITTLVLATISAAFAAIQFSLGIASLDSNFEHHFYSGYYGSRYLWGENYYDGAMAMDGMLVVFAILQAGAAIPSSALICHTLCCQKGANSVNQHTTAAAQCAQMPFNGAYYNPQMAYPLQLQPNPGFINYPQMSPQVDNNQEVSPAEVQITDDTVNEAPATPSEELKEPS